MGMTNLGQSLKARAPRMYASITGKPLSQQLAERVRNRNAASQTPTAPTPDGSMPDGTTSGILVSAVPRGPVRQGQTSKTLLGQ